MKTQLKQLIFGKGFKKRRFIGGKLKGLWGYFDLAQDTQSWRGIYEVEQQDWLQRATKPGSVCIDVGAAEGFFSLLFGKLAGSSGQVISFEPTGRGEEIENLFAWNASMGVASLEIVREFAIGPNTTEVQGVSVDTVVGKMALSRVDVVKIDVDGAEMDVLEGMRGVIEKFHPHLSVELHSPELYAQVKAFLEGYGYEMKLVDPPAYELRPIPFNKFYFSQLPS